MTIDYERAKERALNGSFEEGAALAADENLPAELQVFLAADNSESVRISLAQNKRLPAAAVRLLARDALLKVRETVARHVALLWPERMAHDPEPSQKLAREALMQLATDKAIAVRAALATAIADVAVAPPEVAEMLALDAAQEVAVPILRHYARLDDDFLIDALARRSESWARLAVAERQTVSARVGDAIIATGDMAATTGLLGNSGAILSAEAYETVTSGAVQSPEWQALLVRRPDLPQTSAVRLAEFIDEALFSTLVARSDFDMEMVREIVAVAHRRVDWIESGQVPAIIRVRDMYDQGRLNDDAMRDALAWRDTEFTYLALAVLARLVPEKVQEIIKGNNPKAVVALSWRAGLSARTSLALQKILNGIAPHQYVHPRGGSDYPLSETEMLWQLEFYGIKS